ncbi:peptidylprolyl isomerase [Homoserinibacter sp. YIM 151385]|uniref:peptidylprolyl isomerase n=1 Tax=Homoserinibacter sp. YIM 151385 TaxID=2985506 RepID=UPI0022F0B8E9|nr:peptidylprolyl isomerase [Homoserinibacter sp. YIM 151385]WBU38673.1 peptidylprolyl isomerase [Homoserinibacter sp. YIM 151385]
MASRRQDREARLARDRYRAYSARQEIHAQQRRRRVRDSVIGVVALVVVVGLATTAQVGFFTAGPGAPAPEPSASPSAPAGENVGEVPDPSIAEDRSWTGTLAFNDDIELGIELDGQAAPQATAVFLDEIETEFLVGTTCARMVRSESAGLLQCGSTDGTTASDPGFAFGPIENAPEDGVYPAGTIAMARTGGDAYGNGRQFFIVFEDTTLPADEAGGYTVFGTVTSGLDALVSGIADAGIQPGEDGAESSDGAPVVETTLTAAAVE